MTNIDHSPVFAPFFTIKNHASVGANSAIDNGDLFYPGFTFSNILSLQESFAISAADFVEGIANYVELDPSAPPAYTAYGTDNEIQTKSGNIQDFAAIVAGFYNATHNGSGSIPGGLVGLEAQVINNGTGSVDNAIGLNINSHNNSTGVLDGNYGIFIATPANSGGGTINTSYGIFIGDQSILVGNSFNIYSAGTNSKNFFEGNVGIGTSTPSSKLHVNGSQTVKRVTQGLGGYAVLTTDYYIGKTAITGGGDTITLPAAATAGVGKVYVIKDESGGASVANPIVIDPSGAELIDGLATRSINTNFGSVTIICSGTAWFVI